MGEYADDFNDSGIDAWRGAEAPNSRGAQCWPGDYPPQYTKVAKTCSRCGLNPLYWQKLEEGWRLHAYRDGKYELHTC